MTAIFSALARQAPETLVPADRWQLQAECAATDGGQPLHDPELWFPISEGPAAQQQAASAKAVCYQCPVMNACLRSALDTRDAVGVWGGLDEKERRNLRRRHGRATASDTELQQLAAALLDKHSVPVGDHREWRGPTSIRIKNVVTTPKRIAWIDAHGARPAAALIVTCGHPTCILPAHMELQTSGAPDALTPEEVAEHQASIFTSRSVDVGDGHREWRFSEPVTVGGVTYTARQLAWTVAHGARPAGVLKVACGHKACVAAAHLHDRGVAKQPKAKPLPAAVEQVDRCGTRSGYDDHAARAEAPCRPCTDARDHTDWLLRKGGTHLGLTA